MSITTAAAIDLAEIIALADDLENQAVHRANDHTIPGGSAMVALGPVANHEAWANRRDTLERRALANGEHLPPLEDDDDDWPPLQVLRYWSESWRRQLDMDYDMVHTLTTEAAFLRTKEVLDWARQNEPRFRAFANDVHQARLKLEAILKAGDRDDVSTDVSCLICGERLRRRMTDQGIADDWWCRDCHRVLTQGEFNLALSEAMRAKYREVDEPHEPHVSQ